MALQNRVLPSGDIVAIDARGTMMGNRGGALHDAQQRLGAKRWVSRQWICCLLAFKGRHRAVMSPGRYTELFFLDDATALAAGHRPCFECRREAANHFAACWARAAGVERAALRAADIDRVLHAERLSADGKNRSWLQEIDSLPAGGIVSGEGPNEFFLVQEHCLRPWSAHGYDAAVPRPKAGMVRVLTPPSIISAMKCGYRPIVHETAHDPV